MLYLSGASDDLVELDGDIYDEAQANFRGDTSFTVVLKGGGELNGSLRLGSDHWKITLADAPEGVQVLPAFGEDEPRPDHYPAHVVGYSEVLVVPMEVLKITVEDEELFAK